MATFTLFHEALKYIGDGTIDLDTHTFKAYLATATPVQATHTVKADIAEITAGNGYTAGGFTLACSYTETAGGSGVWRWNVSSDPSWTASGGSIATHQYLIVYDSSVSSPVVSPLVGFVNRGTSDVIADGNTRTWDVGSSGLFEVSATP
jgi:hypothetical protein